MVPGVADGLTELVHRHVRRRQVGVAEPQVDDVLAGPSRLDLERVDDREDVGRKRVDAPEIHRRSVAVALRRRSRAGGPTRSVAGCAYLDPGLQIVYCSVDDLGLQAAFHEPRKPDQKVHLQVVDHEGSVGVPLHLQELVRPAHPPQEVAIHESP